MEGNTKKAVFASVVAMVIVAAVALFVPLLMGPVRPPSGFTLFLFPLGLVVVFILLSRGASNTPSDGIHRDE